MIFVGWIIISFLAGGLIGFIGYRMNSRDDDSTYGVEPDPTDGRGSDLFGRRP